MDDDLRLHREVLLTPREAADYLRVKLSLLQGLTGRGTIPALKFGNITKYLLSDLNTFIFETRNNWRYQKLLDNADDKDLVSGNKS